MGLFDEQTVEEREYKNLLKTIKNQTDSFLIRDYLTDYVTKVRDGNINNPFFEFDFLKKVILELLDSNITELEIKDAFYEIVMGVKYLLPNGRETKDYEKIKNLIIINLKNRLTLIGGLDFDKKFYALFDSIEDYISIINIIAADEKLQLYYTNIVNYALEIAGFVENNTQLKRELLSFINGLSNIVGDIDDYTNERINETKKRFGIYPGIDEKTLANIAREVDHFQNIVHKMESYESKIDSYHKNIDVITQNGIERIEEKSLSAIKSMQDALAVKKDELISHLNDYQKMLEAELKNSSDQVFAEILQQATERIKEIRIQAESIANFSNKEYLRLQKASQDTLREIKSYVENDEQLRQTMASVSEDKTIREALMKLYELDPQQIVASPSSSQIVIPGIERPIVPVDPNVQLRSNYGSITILPAFDESKRFNIRMKEILAKKKRREENGEIFHEMTEEVIRCVLEGDWVYLYGPSGCGKTHLMRQIGSLIGLETVDNGKITDKYSLIGYNDIHGNYRATRAFEASVYGKLLIADELDNGNPDNQIILGEIYSVSLDAINDPKNPHYYIFGEDVRVPINPNFRIISAGNTAAIGENPTYSSRAKSDEAVQQRMTPKPFDYDNRVEKIILQKYPNWFDLIVNFRLICKEWAKKSGLDSPQGMTTTRDAAAINKYIEHQSKTVDQILREKFVQTKQEDYLAFIIKRLKSIYKISDDFELPNKYSLSNIETQELGMRLIRACEKTIGR